MSNKISLCMIVKNEEQNLRRCLDSVIGVVDEIIIVDTGSSDRTKQIAELAGAKVICYQWQDDFSAARNVSLEAATGEWILFLDADEELEAESREALRRVSEEGDNEGYFIKIINFIGDEGCIETCPDIVFRLFHNRPEYRFKGAIHEQIGDVIIKKNNGQAKFQLAEDVIIRHYGYLNQQIAQKDKKNRNLTIIKKELANDPENNTLRYHYGVELFRINHLIEAAAELTKVADRIDCRATYYPKLLRYIVLSYYGAEHYDKALEAALRGLELFPDYADLYYYGGLIQLEQENYAGAYEFFQRTLSLPEQPANYASFSGSRGFRSYYQVGRLAEAFGNEEEALRHYILSLQDNPNFLIAISAIVHILNPREDIAYTRQAMEKLCDFCTNDAKRYIGTVYFLEGAYGLALEYFEIIDLTSLDDNTKMLKAICLIQQNRTLEARHILSSIPAGNQQYPLAKMNEILSYWLGKNRKKVYALCEDFLAFGLSADTGAVVAILRDSLYKRSDSAEVFLGDEGMSLIKDIVARALDRKKFQLAESLLAKVSKASKQGNALELARIFARYGYWDTSKQYTELYLENNKDSADGWCHMGEVLEKLNQHEEACLCYRRVLTLEPRNPRYYVKLINIYQVIRRNLLTEAVEKYPEIPLFSKLLEGSLE